ncbi:MAG TPA: iron-sulfur cluster assembly protein [Solirubrobacteraceae bacterium]|nr:iron-sulfur cluster assembly protein [Solirubrobacteraceae bacterium]
MTTVPEVLGALAGVRDPELDQDLVELGFVTDVAVDGDAVAVRLRLPTFYCAPNFAFLMVADARRVVEALPGVEVARIALEDHFTADEINAAVDRQAGFTDAFPGEAVAELDDLRLLFQRKALTAREGRLGEALLAAGRSEAELASMHLDELPPGPDAERCVQLRAELGIDADPRGPAFVTGDGTVLTAEDIPRFLRFARLVSRSLEGNAHFCRGMLKTRYGLTDEEVAA